MHAQHSIKIVFSSWSQDLIKELKGELSGHFEEVVLALMMTPREYDAFVIRKAIEVHTHYAIVLLSNMLGVGILCGHFYHCLQSVICFYGIFRLWSTWLHAELINTIVSQVTACGRSFLTPDIWVPRHLHVHVPGVEAVTMCKNWNRQGQCCSAVGVVNSMRMRSMSTWE